MSGKIPTPAILGYEAADQGAPAGNKDRAAIYLFGQLEVIDKEGNVITKMFTPILKELFLLVLVYTFKDGKGIASEKLYETLWGINPSRMPGTIFPSTW
ncbi:hypothetical protein [Paraflavitalea speifideaquila]|uniref:hypothetical protein n=1 Tax=Paraflavitalea speifideaquila TaxID=3076558 RepID=UPI0028E1BC5B|nr:hypothetical protein [Paraflavitalea speifideiaquila]